ncbi:MAG: AAA family ATPase [bacterium]|nr:AAA family ATPase [bacterium]
MEIISGYTILERIAETRGAYIFRAQKEETNNPVIIHILKTEYPSPSEVVQFKQEYEAVKGVDLPGVIKLYDLIAYKKGFAIVLEDFEGVTLKDLLVRGPLPLKQFLRAAITIAEILGRIHSKNIVHKSIKPQNILFNPENEEIVISNFGFTNRLTRENETIYQPETIQENLVYLSPEQTGRMNRSVDYRTDFYSLGITYYEMLAGKVPFNSDDPLEVIHSHIAKKPVLPGELNEEIPSPVSDIIMKLLLKTAEERYQSGVGVAFDLKECLEQLETKGHIEPFEPGLKDISSRFKIPQKLFGRDNELKQLIEAFQRVCKPLKKERGVELLLVSGNAGVGKSALVNELHKPVFAKRGYFIFGKYEEFRQDVPYSSIIQAFQRIIRLILSESKEQIHTWKEKILEALDANGSVIAEILPDIELIIGKQPGLPETGPEESKNRFNLVFKNFIKVFAGKRHPLVLFLDDLQWADSASLDLLRKLMTDQDLKYLFLIGAYRDMEIELSYPHAAALKKMEEAGVRITSLSLLPLTKEDTAEFISDFIHSDKEHVLPLAELAHKKTGGNPFFVNQFMKTIYDSAVLVFNPETGWEWDIEKINRVQVTDNLVELMAAKITTLNERTREILKICACIGNRFDLETVAAISGMSIEAALEDLTDAILEDLVDNNTSDLYIFHHDRIQEAAYSLITPADREELHYRIGKQILEKTEAEALEDKIFYIVNQLNLGINLFKTEEELYELAGLNLAAGKKAKRATAYLQALKYLETGIKIITEAGDGICWEKQYALTVSLYEEAAEAAYLNTDYERMKIFSEKVLENARSSIDMVKVYEVEVKTYMARNMPLEAIQTGAEALRKLGIKTPTKCKKFHIVLNYLILKMRMCGKDPQELIDLPELTDPFALAKLRLMSSVSSAAYWADQELLALLILKMIRLSIKHGNTGMSPYNYAAYGLILCVQGRIEKGYKFGELALNLLEKMNVSGERARTLLVMNAFVKHHKKHGAETLEPLLMAYHEGLKSGDVEFASYSLLAYCNHLMEVGDNLEQESKEIEKYIRDQNILKQEQQAYTTRIYHQTILNLMNGDGNPVFLKGRSYNEDRMISIHTEAGDSMTLCSLYFNKLVLSFIFKKYEAALENAERAGVLLGSIAGTLSFPKFYFFDSLVRLALYERLSKGSRKKMLKKVYANLKKLREWAYHAPMNQLHRCYLIEAEIAGVRGKDRKAMGLYKNAIEMAHKNEYVCDEAIANELAAGYYRSIGFKELAGYYMTEAIYVYSRWGAAAKVKDLRKNYHEYSALSHRIYDSPDTVLSPKERISEMLDISTVLKASRALSSEILLNKLLVTMMRILMENAGAEKGIIILEKNDRFLVEAEGSIYVEEVNALQSIPVEEHDGLCPAIINYCSRTQQTLILNDASNEGAFVNDPYVATNKPKSILCAPAINQGRLAAMLYFENNQTIGAFTPERLEVLKIFLSQIAISIENAGLYETLEQKVKERTEELYEVMEKQKAMNKDLIETNSSLEKTHNKLERRTEEMLQAMEDLEIMNFNLEKTYNKLETAHMVAKKDMDMAIHIQRNFLPQEVPQSSDWEVAYSLDATAGVSGDFYDFYFHEDGFTGLGLFDVSGHGIASGLITMLAKSILARSFTACYEQGLNEVLAHANEGLQKELWHVDNYLTGVMLRFKDNLVEYVNAGHPDVFIRSKGMVTPLRKVDGGSVSGLLLGLTGFSFPYDRLIFSVEQGDFILLYTDCLMETDNFDEEEYGIERIKAALTRAPEGSAQEILEYVLNDFYEFIENKERMDDDLTVIVLKKL